MGGSESSVIGALSDKDVLQTWLVILSVGIVFLLPDCLLSGCGSDTTLAEREAFLES